MSLLTNLVSYWKLDEALGDAIDAHASNDLADNTVGSTFGKINGAREFSPAGSDYFSHASNSELTTGDIDFTVAAWVYRDTDPTEGFRQILSKWSATEEEGEYLLDGGQSNGGKFRFAVRSGATFYSVTEPNAYSAEAWYYVIGWHDSVNNSLNIQVNNGTVESASHSAGVNSHAGSSVVMGALGGFLGSSGGYWDGRIDECGFWKRVLTTQERTDLYNGGSGLSYDNFDGGGGGGNPWYYYAQLRTRVRRTWLRNGLIWTPSYAHGKVA